MTTRTHGLTRNCAGCRFWSEMIAMSGPETGGKVVALCLADKGPCHGGYTLGTKTCASWAHNLYGAVDSPPDYGVTVRAMYETEP